MLLKRVEMDLFIYITNMKVKMSYLCHSHVIKSLLIMAEPKKYDYRTFIDNASIHKTTYDGDKLKVLI